MNIEIHFIDGTSMSLIKYFVNEKGYSGTHMGSKVLVPFSSIKYVVFK